MPDNPTMHYDRMILGYHGCDLEVAEQLLAGVPFEKSENDYDWLGHGVYFWEFGPDRALQFASEQKKRGKLKTPSIVGALIQLGTCYDLLDTRRTRDLKSAYELFVVDSETQKIPLPTNTGATPDKPLRRLDCAVVNYWLNYLQQAAALHYDTVRCAFWEGDAIYAGAGFRAESHIQVAVRNPSCILGVFRPKLES